MNLLNDPLFRVRLKSGEKAETTLPGLMAALGRDEIADYPGIQSHQEDAFHVFLCYLAGAILARRESWNPVRDEDFWKDGLLELSGDAGLGAWNLVEDDPTKPAFMQPPIPASHKKTFNQKKRKLKDRVRTPDKLDLLPTSKNLDVKMARAEKAHPDHWIFALVSLQTMSGFYGNGHHGISRMNSGHGNRPIVELVHNESPGRRWLDAVKRLETHRRNVLAMPFGYRDQGLVLVWIEPWDGEGQLPLNRLDPFYVEICRRIRLFSHETENKILACFLLSSKTRIAAKHLKGYVGDAWLPVKMPDGKKSVDPTALTVGPSGPTPDLLRSLIFEDGFQLTALQKPRVDMEGPVSFRVSVLVRGQGTTDGFHRRTVRIPNRVRRTLFGKDPGGRQLLAELSRTGIEFAGIMTRSVLKPAVFTLLEGAPERIAFDRESPKAWWTRAERRFEALWSQDYFHWLWEAAKKQDRSHSERLWAGMLRDHALIVLREAASAMPGHCGRQHKSRVQAERVFWRNLYAKNNFPFLKEDEHGTG